MKVSSEPIENSQVSLSVEMEAAEVDKYLNKAYNHLVKRVAVPGFRKGKTPRAILERHIGAGMLFQEALEYLIPEIYIEALESQSIDAIDQPQNELLQAEPLIFKAIVPIRPTVKLGDYHKIKLETEPVEINDTDVDIVMAQLQQQNAVLLPVERTVQFGDIVTIDIEDKRGNEYVPIGKGLVYEVEQNSKLPLPGFAEKIEGRNKDEETSFVLSYPNDYEVRELAGKEHFLRVNVTEIKEKQLPSLDDAFAKGIGSDSIAALREQMATTLKTRAEEKARVELEQKAIDAVVDISELEYPPAVVERAIERLLSEEARNFPEGGKGLENYLTNLGKTIKDHREELRPVATQRVVRSLVLEKITEAEKIEINDLEIDSEIDKMVKNSGEQAEEMKRIFNLPESRDSIKYVLVSKKTVERLVAIATGST
jgi:trigger factor